MAITQKRWASNRKVTKLEFDSRCFSAHLCTLKRHLMLFPTLGPSSLSVVVAQPNEKHANRSASMLEWYDRHRALIVQHLVQSKKKYKNN